MCRRIFNQKGQSLLELLVALLILVVALTATITLIVSSINAGKESRNRLIATSLAREGIEIVRNIRDSNWTDPASPAPQWDSGLNGATAAATPVIGVTGTPVAITFDNGANAQIRFYNNTYVQGTGAPGTNAQFYRVIYVNSICYNSDSNPIERIVNRTDTFTCGQVGSYVEAYPNKVGIRITSEVHWPTSNSNKKVIVEDRLYNWQEL